MNAATREILTDAVRFWEILRAPYNIVLAGVVLTAHFGQPEPQRHTVSPGSLVALGLAAVAANLLYCSAYLPDVFLQMTAYRNLWRRWRWLLFTAGLLLASTLALLTVAPAWFQILPNQQ
jgi:hypothetical protein